MFPWTSKRIGSVCNFSGLAETDVGGCINFDVFLRETQMWSDEALGRACQEVGRGSWLFCRSLAWVSMLCNPTLWTVAFDCCSAHGKFCGNSRWFESWCILQGRDVERSGKLLGSNCCSTLLSAEFETWGDSLRFVGLSWTEMCTEEGLEVLTSGVSSESWCIWCIEGVWVERIWYCLNWRNSWRLQLEGTAVLFDFERSVWLHQAWGSCVS